MTLYELVFIVLFLGSVVSPFYQCVIEKKSRFQKDSGRAGFGVGRYLVILAVTGSRNELLAYDL